MAEREPQPNRDAPAGGNEVSETARRRQEELARERQEPPAVPAAEFIGRPPRAKQGVIDRVFDFKKPNNPFVVTGAAAGLVTGVGLRDTMRALFRGGWETLRGVVTGKERPALGKGWEPGKGAGGEAHALKPKHRPKEKEHHEDHGDHGGGHGGEEHGGGHGGDHGGGHGGDRGGGEHH